MSLFVTEHAVDRYTERWSPGTSRKEARAALEGLVSAGAATRRLTVKRDARLWVTMTQIGAQLVFAVRDRTVVTVLPPDPHDMPSSQDKRIAPDSQRALAESEDDVAACREMLHRDTPHVAPPPPPPPVPPDPIEDDRRRSARELLEAWGAGVRVSDKALRRAHAALGQPWPPLVGRLRFDGGRYHGLVIEVRDDEAPAAVASRIRRALEDHR